MCVCRHTYVAGQCRQKLVCCEHHPPWQCKPPLIQNRKCLPSGLQEPPPTTNNKKHCQLQEVTYLRVASGQRAGIQFNEKIWVKIGQKGSAPVTKVTNNFLHSLQAQKVPQLFSTPTARKFIFSTKLKTTISNYLSRAQNVFFPAIQKCHFTFQTLKTHLDLPPSKH